MDLNTRQNAFAELGRFLTQYTSEDPSFTASQKPFATALDKAVFTAVQHNSWFTKEDIYFNLRQWSENLNTESLTAWLSSYELQNNAPKTIAIIMAGNVPLVGFHDFLCVMLSGHKALIKQSSKDKHLLPWVVNFLINQEETFSEQVEFTDNRLENFEAVIATGSNNTARYFEYYFSEKPHIIRKNRNSIAVLTGDETVEDLKNFGEDLFRYFGLGCRNVSKVFVPKGYDFKTLFEAIYPWNSIINSHKYANNYDYNKAVYLMSEFKILENGFFILKEDENYASPIACLFYAYYEDEESLKEKLEQDAEQIQCIVSKKSDLGHLDFGQSQRPKHTDYADGIDTLAFLCKI